MIFNAKISGGGGEPGELGTPTVSSSGLVTATITKGGVLEEGTSTTLQLSTQDAKTITPSTSPQTAVDVGKFTTGVITVDAMPTATQATPSITVSSAGLITASATQTAGYVAEGTESATKQLTVQAAKTVTPSASVQTAVAAGRYTTGAVNVAAIPTTYKQLATGTVTASNNKVKVSGLSFTPAHLCLVSTQSTSQVTCSYDGNGHYGNTAIGVTCTFSSGSFTATSNYGGAAGQFAGTYNYVTWS